MFEFLTKLDRSWAAWFASVRTNEGTLFFRLVTELGAVEAVILFSLVIMAFLGFRRNWPYLKFFVFTIGGGEMVNESLKWLFHRSRPPLPWFTSAHGYSFPSGHSLMSTVFYIFIAWLVYRHFQPSAGRSVTIAVFLAVPVLVGISRIYLGVHFLTDVVGGWCIGLLWLTYAIHVWPKDYPPDDSKVTGA